MTSCTLSAILSVWVAVPLGYLISRHRFFGRNFLDALIDVPIVLPPLVVGLSLLIMFQFWPFSLAAREIVYQLPAVVLAQFSVACAFAVRTMKGTFDHIDPRCERVALSLGCTRLQAFGWVVLPEARRGMTTAFTLAWARSLGEFGPLLIFAGATRMKTEVLSTTVFLEMNVGDISAAVAVSLIMVAAAVIVLIIARVWGSREGLL
jgi:molybdate transport system permease protein